ncbi:MAG TPA: hypothetical protein VG297_05280, partial [Bryobacteraceae bacterium]|nr:hypothetical protein [Bryobacteraceae bacterium]
MRAAAGRERRLGAVAEQSARQDEPVEPPDAAFLEQSCQVQGWPEKLEPPGSLRTMAEAWRPEPDAAHSAAGRAVRITPVRVSERRPEWAGEAVESDETARLEMAAPQAAAHQPADESATRAQSADAAASRAGGSRPLFFRPRFF